MKNVVILISGRGSNMQAILDQPSPAFRIAAVISNSAAAPGLDVARAHGVPALAVEHTGFATREAFDTALAQAVDAAQPDLVVLAGFMRRLTPGFVARYQDRIINIHPSLLPLFPGLHTHRRALEAGVKVHGCTVHFVTPELDSGPIIAQAVVPVLAGDDEAALAARVLKQEHILYPRAVRWFCEDLLSRDAGGRVRLSGDAAAQAQIAAGAA